MVDDIGSVYRDFNNINDPSSGDYEPEKARIRALLRSIRSLSGQAITKGTLAELTAITPPTENYMGIVLDDPDPTNNGYYSRVAAAWVFQRGFPDTFAVLASIGGTANAITASTASGIDPSDVVCLLLPDPPGTNSSSTVTLAINGGSAENVKAASGANLAVGDIIEGVGTLFFKSGSEWRQLFSSATGATFDHQGDYAGGTTYTEGQLVTGSNGNWYQLKVPTAQGDDPVGSVTGNWLQVLAAAALPDGSVGYPKLEPTLADHIYRTLAAEDLPFFADPVSGDDDNNTGSDSSPFKTISRGIAEFPALMGKYKGSVNLVAGTPHTESYIPAADQQRPAIIPIDGRVQIGLRSDLPGGAANAGLTIRGLGAVPGDTIVQYGGDFSYCLYATGGAGSVAAENFRTLGVAGANAALVGHRGCYLHLNKIESDGDSLSTFAWLAEAGGKVEAVDSKAWDCTILALAYDQSFVQIANNSELGASGTYAAQSAGGLVSIFGAVSVLSKIFAVGGKIAINGSGANRPNIDAIVEVRSSIFTASLADFKNVVIQMGGDSDWSQCRWGSQITQNGGHFRMAACKSYIDDGSPVSGAATPWAILSGGTSQIDALTEIINSAGTIVSPSYTPLIVSLTGNDQPVPIAITDKHATLKLAGGGADRTGAYLSAINNRFSGSRPGDGQLVSIIGTTADAVQLVDHTGTIGSAFPSGGINIAGSGAGKHSGVTLMYHAALNQFREVARSAAWS